MLNRHRTPSHVVPPPAARLLGTAEVARALGMSNRTVLAWAQAGRLASITTPGGHRRYPSSDVARVAAQMGLAWAHPAATVRH